MVDPKLRSSGTTLLALGALGLAFGILANSISRISPVTSISLGIAVLLLLVGGVAWILGRLGGTTTPVGANPRLRRLGYRLMILGLFISVAGVFGVAFTRLDTLSRDVSQAAETAGFYIAIAGTVIVAFRNRLRVHRTAAPASKGST
ncbi:MAG: hypothetical protein ACRECT_00105 [Thermoplasmata archaeon]